MSDIRIEITNKELLIAIRNEFSDSHNAKMFKMSKRHISAILRSCGASKDAVINLIGKGDYVYDGPLRTSSGPFDHLDIWGRDGKPLALVAHPYHLNNKHFELLNTISDIGLDVHVGWRSYYGYGTVQVVAANPKFYRP